ncbi:hypothetical protein [Paenibacillus profundus]|uniref:hypothetical protein n=1 Tax=Paenibacillus profundus TaxID=1173085 RepID=UPI002D7FCE9F|nr:hypothetical protein [Paenibacillus profundus]
MHPSEAVAAADLYLAVLGQGGRGCTTRTRSLLDGLALAPAAAGVRSRYAAGRRQRCQAGCRA